jgi:hypothetical protein
MSLAKMERLLIGKKWPKNSHGQPAEGGPLQRDALKDALYKFFPDDP